MDKEQDKGTNEGTEQDADGAGDGTTDRKEQNWREAIARHEKRAKVAEERLAKMLSEQDAAKRAAEEAKLDEVERLKRQLAEKDAAVQQAHAAVQRERRDNAVRVRALREGAHDADDVLAIAGAKVELDDDGTPSNLDEIFAALKEKKPHLFATVEQVDAKKVGTTPPPNGAPRRTGTKRMTRHAFEAMDAKQQSDFVLTGGVVHD